MSKENSARNSEMTKRRLKRRHAAEKRFRLYGIAALAFGAAALLVLGLTLLSSGMSAFQRTVIETDITFDLETLGVSKNAGLLELNDADYYSVFRKSIYSSFDFSNRQEKKQIPRLFTRDGAEEVKSFLLKYPESLGKTEKIWITASSDIDQLHKGVVSIDWDPMVRRVSDYQVSLYRQLVAGEKIRKVFNWGLFASGDSRNAEQAGLGGAILGSFFTLLVCFLFAFPLGVGAAVYLEEFAPKNKFSDLIEVNINNLAAVPSIIFGLLGLAIILNVMAFPRGTPLVGGIVLALMTLPTIIVACRASLKAVPPSIREAALAMGASPMQVVLHHVLPLAMPGTLTGTIIGLARALGETAPLLMIGMVAFIADVPTTPLEPSAVLPVQIFLWAESAERGFVEKTSAAILIILIFLICMNLTAVYLRRKYERRW